MNKNDKLLEMYTDDDGIEKVAFNPIKAMTSSAGGGSMLEKAVATALISGTIGLGGMALKAGAGFAMGKYQRKMIFDKIMQLNPSIRKSKGPAKVIYDAIVKYAPSIASDVSACAKIIEQRIEYPPDYLFYNNLAQMEKTVREGRSRSPMSMLAGDISRGGLEGAKGYKQPSIRDQYKSNPEKKEETGTTKRPKRGYAKGYKKP